MTMFHLQENFTEKIMPKITHKRKISLWNKPVPKWTVPEGSTAGRGRWKWTICVSGRSWNQHSPLWTSMIVYCGPDSSKLFSGDRKVLFRNEAFTLEEEESSSSLDPKLPSYSVALNTMIRHNSLPNISNLNRYTALPNLSSNAFQRSSSINSLRHPDSPPLYRKDIY